MRRLYCLSLALLLMPAWAWAKESIPQAGQVAPAFRLQDQHGHWQSLSAYRGQWLVLYFYPKDFTPGCTTEVCKYRDAYLAIRKERAQVLAISLDDVKSHAAFARKYHAPFPMLADTGHVVARAYGVLTSLLWMKYAARTTFIIAPDGRIAKVFTGVNPDTNSQQVLAVLPKLQAAYPKA